MNDPDRTSAFPDDDAVWRAVARSLSGEASPGEDAALRRELDAHPQRAALVEALGGALGGLRADAAPAVDVEAALASVLARRDRPVLTVERGGAADPARPRRPVVTPAVRPRWRTPALLRMAASAVLVLGAALLWRALSGGGAAGGWQAQYATDVGARREIRLPDGTRVVLGPASQLAVAGGYGRARRTVQLSGQAYFEVVHNDARPFRVRTPAAEIADVGTAFTVATDDTRIARVAVTSGAVEVTPPSGSATLLRAGDRAAVAAGKVTVQRGAATADDVAWTRGRLAFRDAPLAEVAAALRRWYGVTLRVDPALAERHLTADFEGQTADGAMRIVAATLGGELRRSGDTAVIVSPGADQRAP